MADDETPRPDPRPRPQYGELAPEGWTWDPEPERTHHTAHEQRATTLHPAPPERVRRPAPAWDRPVTLLLLIAGILGLFLNIGVVTSAPQSLAMLYATEQLGDYEMDAAVPALMTAASVTQLVLYIATAAASILLLVKHRRAFFMPLIGGALAAAANLAFMTAIVATDQTLLQYYAGM